MTSDEIKEWLKEIHQNREWLAEQCSVSKSTVNGWLSADRPIPGPSLTIIEQLRSGPPGINPQLSVSDFLAAQKQAQTEGLSLDEWIAKLMRNAVQSKPVRYTSSSEIALVRETDD